VLIFNFPTTPEDEAEIARRLGYNDDAAHDPRGLNCANTISDALSGVGPFKQLKPTRFPGSLANQLRRLMGLPGSR
jgi:hypothetical protein